MDAGGDQDTAAVPRSKTRAPPAPAAWVRRDRLTDRLLDGAPGVVAVCGPAGSGKSTALAAALAWPVASDAAPPAVAWVSFDRDDDHPVRLWSSILAALQRSGAFAADGRIHDLPPSSDGSGAAILAAIETATDEMVTPSVWLVLDDVHELTDPTAMASLELLLRRRPSRLRVALSSRVDPSPGLARLRVAGEVRDLPAGELTFTDGEAATLFERHGLPLTAASVRLLQARTEGWVAAVRLAATTVAVSPDGQAAIARFDGEERTVAAYLDDEVLARQPPTVRRFLRETSTCAELTVDLAEHLTGCTDAGALLRRLDRHHVLTTRFGDGSAYRYHPLLRGHLAAELRGLDHAAFRRVHARAAGWHDARGDGPRALEHAVEVDDERLVATLERYGLAMLMDGRGDRLRAAFAALTGGWRTAPIVVLLRTQLDLVAGRPPTTADLVALSGSELSRDPEHAALHAVVALHAAVAPHGVATPATSTPTMSTAARRVELVTAAIDRVVAAGAGTSGDEALDLLALHHLGLARVVLGDHRGAVRDLERAAHLAEARCRPAVAVACLSLLATAAFGASDVVGMRRHADRAITLAERNGRRAGVAVNAHLARATAAYLRVDREAAARHVADAAEALEPHTDRTLRTSAGVLGALIDADAGGARPATLLRLRAAWDAAGDAELGPAFHALTVPVELRLCAMLGRPQWAVEAADRLRERYPWSGEALLATAQLAVARGDHTTARADLAPILCGVTACTVELTVIRAWLLAAELATRRGSELAPPVEPVTGPGSLASPRAEVRARPRDEPDAFACLVAALDLAVDQDLLRPFVDTTPAVKQVLETNLGRFGRAEGLVTRVRSAVGAAESGTGGLIDPLTPAERRLLRDLPTMATVAELAAARDVTANTVKTHLRSVYRKLGATNRRSAVAVARRHGLL